MILNRAFRIALAVQALTVGYVGGARAILPEGGIGVGYLHPVSDEISHTYGGGISFHAMGEIPVSRFIRIAGEIGYRRSSATLSHPDFMDAARGTLRTFPIDLVARIASPRAAAISPHVGAGCELLWLKERFTYRMLTRETVRSPSARFGIGPVVVAGIDRTRSPRIRLEAVASLVAIRRAVAFGDTSVPTERIVTGSYGARILWRLP